MELFTCKTAKVVVPPCKVICFFYLRTRHQFALPLKKGSSFYVALKGAYFKSPCGMIVFTYLFLLIVKVDMYINNLVSLIKFKYPKHGIRSDSIQHSSPLFSIPGAGLYCQPQVRYA